MITHKNAVLQGLEDMRKFDGHGRGLVYVVHPNVKAYTTDQMIEEVKNETPVGIEFTQSIYDNIISYMGKFTQNPTDKKSAASNNALDF